MHRPTDFTFQWSKRKTVNRASPVHPKPARKGIHTGKDRVSLSKRHLSCDLKDEWGVNKVSPGTKHRRKVITSQENTAQHTATQAESSAELLLSGRCSRHTNYVIITAALRGIDRVPGLQIKRDRFEGSNVRRKWNCLDVQTLQQNLITIFQG